MVLQGAGTYGIVREADGPDGKVAVKIILKKNVKGNEQMVYDELKLLQRLNHPHIVRFRDWFESRVSWDFLFLALQFCLVLYCRDTDCLGACRINTTSLLSWRRVVNCSIVFASMGNSLRRMRPKSYARFCKLSTTFIALISSTEVSSPNQLALKCGYTNV